MGIQIGATVERLDGRQLGYRDFVERYLKKNIPVVLTGLMDSWPACTDWVTPDGRPNLRFFADHFGNSMVQVADCSKKDFTDQKRVEMSVSKYIDYCLGISINRHEEVTNRNDDTEPLLYLKDWHFVKAIWWECTQEQNEIIFVPSGWYHQVHNLEDTISINHNWFNGHNLSWVWKLLVKDYNEAKEYIEDIRDICDDFESICQRNLAANTGMNFYDFFAFLTRFALANMALLRELEDQEFSQSRSISYHVINNMHAIHSVASSMGSVEAFAEENSRIRPDENCDAKRIMEGPDFRVLCADLGTILKDMCAEHRQDDGVGRKIPHRTDLSNLLDFKIHNPAELVKLIELAIADHFNACEFKAHDV